MLIAASPPGPGEPPSSSRRIVALAAIFGATFGMGLISDWVAAPNVSEWYDSLNKPNFNPPNWLFVPVWSVLYFLMSVSAWLAWQAAPASQRIQLLTMYAGQLLLNLFWPIAFFSLHLPLLAYLDSLLLAAAILWLIVRFRRVNRLAGWLLIPYLLWVGFAMLLNLAIVLLN